MIKNPELGDAADDFDDVDAFGLDQFGQARGLSPMWGAVAGSGLPTVVSMGARRLGGAGFLGRHHEAAGFLAGAAAAGAMIAMKGTRAAGWTALAAAFLSSGLRAVEAELFGGGGLSGVVIDPTTAFQGHRGGGMGLVEVNPATAFSGGQMPQLVGANLQSASDHLQLVGGPALSDIAHHWGHTHFSR